MDIKLRNIAVEFIFDAKIKNQSKRVSFYREFYGCKKMSNYGKYIYIIDGVLSGIKHIKPVKSVVIVSIEDSEKLRNFFKKYNVFFDEKLVVLNENNSKILGLSFPEKWNKKYHDLLRKKKL